MRLIHELLIVAMETIGIVCVAVGLGLVTAWWAGTAGLFLTTGLCLLIAAGYAAYQQRRNNKKPEVKK